MRFLKLNGVPDPTFRSLLPVGESWHRYTEWGGPLRSSFEPVDQESWIPPKATWATTDREKGKDKADHIHLFRGHLSGGNILLSSRAASVLEEWFTPIGQLLPIDVPGEEIVCFHPTETHNHVMDEERTLREKPGDLTVETRFSFRLKEARRTPIFLLKPKYGAWLVFTEPVVERIREHGLKGFRYHRILMADELDLPRSRGPRAPADPRVVPFDAKFRSLIEGSAEEALELLALPANTPPEALASAVHEKALELRDTDLGDEEARYGAMLGALWGEQIRRAYGWRWVLYAPSPEQKPTYALLSPDDAYVVYPLQRVWGTLREKRAPSTLLLQFNLLADPEAAGAAREPKRYLVLG